MYACHVIANSFDFNFEVLNMGGIYIFLNWNCNKKHLTHNGIIEELPNRGKKNGSKKSTFHALNRLGDESSSPWRQNVEHLSQFGVVAQNLGQQMNEMTLLDHLEISCELFSHKIWVLSGRKMRLIHSRRRKKRRWEKLCGQFWTKMGGKLRKMQLCRNGQENAADQKKSPSTWYLPAPRACVACRHCVMCALWSVACRCFWCVRCGTLKFH